MLASLEYRQKSGRSDTLWLMLPIYVCIVGFGIKLGPGSLKVSVLPLHYPVRTSLDKREGIGLEGKGDRVDTWFIFYFGGWDGFMIY